MKSSIKKNSANMKRNKPKVVVIIPSRFDSTRFKGKPLAEINGKPMIFHVYNKSKKARNVDDVIIATDDERIKTAVEDFDGKVMMTSKKHHTGTERVAEVAKVITADIVVNVQGDEPLINPKCIEQVIEPLISNKDIKMTTMMTKIKNEEELNNPNTAKVVTDQKGFALYFSRSLIPYPRNKEAFEIFKHIGIYGYRKDFLLDFANMPQTVLEKIESLEQLRALENGIKIKVIETKYDSIGVDTPEDLELVRKKWRKY